MKADKIDSIRLAITRITTPGLDDRAVNYQCDILSLYTNIKVILKLIFK